MFQRRTRRSRATGRRRPLSVEALERRELLSLNWSTYGEGSVVDDTVQMGVPNRREFHNQPSSFHGASAVLAPAASYKFPIDFDLRTWDSYNSPCGASGRGYWDVFSVSVTRTPYPQLGLTDPIAFAGLGFTWGGTRWGDGILENTTGSQQLTIPGDPNSTNYLNVVLDTRTPPCADTAYPSWGTITVHPVHLGPDIAILNARFDGSPAKVAFQYRTTTTDGAFTVGLYWSTDTVFDSRDKRLATRIVPPTGGTTQAGNFEFLTPLQSDPRRPYVLVVADPFGVIPEADEGNNVAAFVLPTVALKTSPKARSFTLMDDVGFKVEVSPPGPTASSCTVERTKAIDVLGLFWKVVADSCSATVTQRLAGYFRYRASAVVDGIAHLSRPLTTTVHFPSFTQIVSNETVQDTTKAAWASTLTRRMEEGFWIRLNTATGTHEFTDTVLGGAGAVVLGFRPADTPAADGESAVYTVASFHTHPTADFPSNLCRRVGPSDADQRADRFGQLIGMGVGLGIVYDYVGIMDCNGSGIPGGHPAESDATWHKSGLDRRPTPRL